MRLLRSGSEHSVSLIGCSAAIVYSRSSRSRAITAAGQLTRERKSVNHGAPAEQDAIVSAIIADLRMRRPMTFAPFGLRGQPAPPSADPKGQPAAPQSQPNLSALGRATHVRALGVAP